MCTTSKYGHLFNGTPCIDTQDIISNDNILYLNLPSDITKDTLKTVLTMTDKIFTYIEQETQEDK